MSESLKDYALRIYRADGVREALLALQDQSGCDVTVLLWGLWLAACGREPGTDKATALDWSRTWGASVTGPLRETRRAAKPLAAQDAAISALRDRIKTVELDSEIVTLERLEQIAPGQRSEGDFVSLANGALNGYAQSAGLTASFDTLIAAVSRADKKL